MSLMSNVNQAYPHWITTDLHNSPDKGESSARVYGGGVHDVLFQALPSDRNFAKARLFRIARVHLRRAHRLDRGPT